MTMTGDESMTTPQDDTLAERAARAMGWRCEIVPYDAGPQRRHWVDAAGIERDPPDLTDPAFCWTMWAHLEVRDPTALRCAIVAEWDDGDLRLSSLEDIPAALARCLGGDGDER